VLDKKVYLQKDKLLMAFQMFDEDGNGKISRDEIKIILGNTDFNQEIIEHLIQEAD